jgi:Chaperone of endosialidase
MKTYNWFNRNLPLSHLRIATASRRAPSRCGFLLIALALTLASFALSPTAGAFCNDGCNLNFLNTFLGDEALNGSACELDCGVRNTAVGFRALRIGNSASDNTATGAFALSSNTTGSNNTADGSSALRNNTTGLLNTATGSNALFANTTGIQNTANGVNALVSNTTGANNTANGTFALASNRTGFSNTANGVQALVSNTTGANNTASGVNSLASNTTGFNDTATGVQALNSNTTGVNNTATGNNALFQNTTGANNTANGIQALQSNTTGSSNTAAGVSALLHNTTGSRNIALGFNAGTNLTNGSNNIAIGSLGVAGDASKIRIGTVGTQTATFIAGIFNQASVGGATVLINSSGKLGTNVSSARFKQNIEDMGDSSHALMALRPVTFHYKPELDPDGIAQFGLVAEEVEKVNPALIVRDADGKPYAVRYEAVNAMLLNEFLKEHRKVQELEKDLRTTIAQQQKEIKALTATVQRVSDQIQLTKPAPQMVAND